MGTKKIDPLDETLDRLNTSLSVLRENISGSDLDEQGMPKKRKKPKKRRPAKERKKAAKKAKKWRKTAAGKKSLKKAAKKKKKIWKKFGKKLAKRYKKEQSEVLQKLENIAALVAATSEISPEEVLEKLVDTYEAIGDELKTIQHEELDDIVKYFDKMIARLEDFANAEELDKEEVAEFVSDSIKFIEDLMEDIYEDVEEEDEDEDEDEEDEDEDEDEDEGGEEED